jgi:hypothetical protein
MALKLKANKDAIVFNKDEPVLISGAYYIPQVSEDGVLTWVPSGADMPVVEAAIIRGPQGNPGVYIGDNPGENDKVWIQPDAAQETVDDKIEEAINSIVIVDEVSY